MVPQLVGPLCEGNILEFSHIFCNRRSMIFHACEENLNLGANFESERAKIAKE